jgi:hypothetical protein
MANDEYGLQLARPHKQPQRQPQGQRVESSNELPAEQPAPPMSEREARARVAARTPLVHLECRAENIRTQIKLATNSHARTAIMIGFGMCSVSPSADGKGVIVTTKEHRQPVEVLDALRLGLFT